MGETAKKFIPRAPRYVLRPGDDQFVRFALKEDHYKTTTTRFINISATGLAFIIDFSHAPHLGDLIKLEVPLTDYQKIAWWARVVRVEERQKHSVWSAESDNDDDREVVVAVQFHNMPEAHRLSIGRTLEKKFNDVQAQRRQQWAQEVSTYIRENVGPFFFYLLLTLLTIGLLYYLSRPAWNYDAKRGAPWGHRFNTDF